MYYIFDKYGMRPFKMVNVVQSLLYMSIFVLIRNELIIIIDIIQILFYL
jgi:hypothetical protein